MDYKRRRLERLSQFDGNESGIQRQLADEFRRQGDLLDGYLYDWRSGNTNPDCEVSSPTMHALKGQQSEWLESLPKSFRCAYDPTLEPKSWVSMKTAIQSRFPVFGLKPGFQFQARQLKQLIAFPILRHLDLSWTTLENSQLEQLLSLARLYSLNLAYTQVGDGSFSVLSQFRDLEVLRLAETQLTPDGLAEIGLMTGLKALTIARVESNKVAAKRFDQFCHGLAQCQRLEQLELSNVSISKSAFAELNQLPQLRSLRLWNTRTRMAGIASLKAVSTLQTLDLSGNPIYDADLRVIGQMSQLRYLSLCRTKISDAGLEHLQNLPYLHSLDLSDCAISGSGLASLARLKSLRNLVLNRCQLRSGRTRAISRLKNLEKLCLSCNSLAETDLEPLRELPKLSYLDLSGIHGLDEAVFPILGALPALKLLNLKFTRSSVMNEAMTRHLAHVKILN